MAFRLTQTLDALPGVGPTRVKALQRLGLSTVGTLLDHFPRDYEDRSVQAAIAPLPSEVPVCFVAMVTESFRTSRVKGGLELLKGSISDESATVSVTFFQQSYVAHSLQSGKSFLFYGKLSGFGARRSMTNPLFEPLEAPQLLGGITPRYPSTSGLSQKLLFGLVGRILPPATAPEESLPEALLSQYELPALIPSYREIHRPSSWEALAAARRRFIFEELLCLALGLSLLRRRRQEEGAFAFCQGDVALFFATLPFSPTAAQRRAMAEIAKDLDSTRPMNRLLQGDVGSGKTAVAAAAIYLATQNACQSALMAPTELLAQQHHQTMTALLAPLGLRIGLLTGSLSAGQKRAMRAAAAAGDLDLLIGTHALLTDELCFLRLGLVITDEQHRFGVSQRAKLSAKAGEVFRPHVLVMSATPIPRTLALMIYGDLDLSVLDELPPGRQTIQTLLIGEDKRSRLYGFLRQQIALGQQVYLVCPTVEEGEQADLKSAESHGAALRDTVFPYLRVGILHGKMKPREKEAVMAAFLAGQIQLLVTTTVIEVGVDVPNATLMVIENAERFGLSQLHQLRGRVGRGSALSFCVLISDTKSDSSRARLQTFKQTGDGFRIAEEDLRLRGPGDFFGARQHGLPPLHIADLAGDMRVLKQAQEAALALLAQDPALSDPAHRPLLRKVLTLFDEHRDHFT